jgi:benzoyl-CoA reductase/2-hydroxyglutaryl-CoA dehydratase subunit BcrC/BadD/HgdB
MSAEGMVTVDEVSQFVGMAKTQFAKAPGMMKSAVGYMDMVQKYVDRIRTAKDEGKFVVTHGTQQPLEIFEAMDVVGVFNEAWGVLTTKVNRETISEAMSVSASTGTPEGVCSFFRNMDGLLHAGKWPKTDCFVHSSCGCDNVKAFQTLGRRYNIPSFGMERPYMPHTRQAMEHWKNEHQLLIAFLEEKTGKKMDYDRLKETIRLSYRLTELHLEIDKLVKRIPCPMSWEAFGGTMLATRLFPGTQYAIDYLTQLKAELQERIDNGIGAVKEERFRVMWSTFTPFWDMSLLGLMQERYGAVSVCEHLARWRGDAKWLLDEDDPLGNLAYRTLVAPGNSQYSTTEDWAGEVVNLAVEYQADAAIFNNNFGCKTGAASGPLIRDLLMKECGVPTLSLSCDVVDPNFVSRPEIVSQLDGFFEMIESNSMYQERLAARREAYKAQQGVTA